MPSKGVTIRVGTRGSLLARTQTESVVQTIRRHFPLVTVSTNVISTEGDRVQDVPISDLGDKGVFVRTLESALLSGEIDLAVHSLKDVPSDREVTQLRLAAFSAREDARDVLISRHPGGLERLPSGAVVGTSSLRRRVQLAASRHDLRVQDIRGNVDTRLRKLQAGEYDALILAAAGLHRLGLHDQISEYLEVDDFTPDAGQGILAVETRRDHALDAVTAALDDRTAHVVADAERACVRALGADCRSPVGAYATVDRDVLLLIGMAACEDGSRLSRASARGTVREPVDLGQELGTRLRRAISD